MLNLPVKSQKVFDKCRLGDIVFGLIMHDDANNFYTIILKSGNHGLTPCVLMCSG